MNQLERAWHAAFVAAMKHGVVSVSAMREAALTATEMFGHNHGPAAFAAEALWQEEEEKKWFRLFESKEWHAAWRAGGLPDDFREATREKWEASLPAPVANYRNWVKTMRAALAPDPQQKAAAGEFPGATKRGKQWRIPG